MEAPSTSSVARHRTPASTGTYASSLVSPLSSAGTARSRGSNLGLLGASPSILATLRRSLDSSFQTADCAGAPIVSAFKSPWWRCAVLSALLGLLAYVCFPGEESVMNGMLSDSSGSSQQLRGSNTINSNAESTTTKEIWSDFTKPELKSHLKCSEYYERAEQTIHGQDAWKLMRRKYVDIVGGTESTIGPPESEYNGFSRPYSVGHTDHGRGIYAKTDIPKGSLVWHNIRTAAFSEGQQFREFVMTLPRELGCDVLQWSYAMGKKIYCDLDEGSFCNDGRSKGSNIDIDEVASAKFIAKAGLQLFATRDIKEGEELLCNYSSFANSDAWENLM